MANWRDRATRVPSLSHSQPSSMSRPANFMFLKPGWLESPAERPSPRRSLRRDLDGDASFFHLGHLRCDASPRQLERASLREPRARVSVLVPGCDLDHHPVELLAVGHVVAVRDLSPAVATWQVWSVRRSRHSCSLRGTAFRLPPSLMSSVRRTCRRSRRWIQRYGPTSSPARTA